MKKLSYLFIAIISLIGFTTVNADTLSFNIDSEEFDKNIEFYLDHESEINSVISKWETDLSSQYPYYAVFVFLYGGGYDIYLTYYERNSTHWTSDGLEGYDYESHQFDHIIKFRNGAFVDDYTTIFGYDLLLPLINNGILYNNVPYSYLSNGNEIVYDYDKILFNSFISSTYDFSSSSFEIGENDLLPSYLDLYNGTYQKNNLSNYVEINLNDYAYVALSLKDYSLRNDDINQFSTSIYTKGQLCLTPVYNYGMVEKSSAYGSNYQVQGCSVYYDNFTPIRTYILKQDLENHAIYYVKAYDISKDNIIKVDSSVFDVSYVTSENSSNPTVTVNGRSYPTIAYDSLSSSSTKSESDGYVSGRVCNLGDLNCYDEATGSNFSDIFDSPLKVLKSVWSSISSVFSLISEFISFLPTELRSFLYLAFMLAIVLGILKIIL